MQTGPAADLSWRDVWSHGMTNARVATALRIALDDANGQVVAAAAQGIAALLPPSKAAEPVTSNLLPAGESS